MGTDQRYWTGDGQNLERLDFAKALESTRRAVYPAGGTSEPESDTLLELRLEARARFLREELAKMDAYSAKLARIDRMLEAAK